MMRVSVTKMHGAHNDFVVLDRRVAPVRDLAAFARWACDRHAGVGADGLIALESSTRADVRMRTINADGTQAEMCGNGIRCAARWLDEAGLPGPIAFETDAGIVRTEIVARNPEYLIRVAVGWPRMTCPIPRSLPVADFVDLGNPHVVVFEGDIDALDLEALAAGFQDTSAFPQGTNVHVATSLRRNAIRVRHWERGAGLTQACGTGAVASAAAAIGREMVESPVEVFVPGGALLVEWDGAGEAYLTGPATRVFDTDVQF